MPALYLRHFDGFTPPYFLPAGGSSPVGAIGYVEGALEIAAQVAAGEIPEPTHVVTAAGSGGTAAGLAVGLRLAGLTTTVVAVVVNDSLRLDRRALTNLGRRTEKLLRRRGAVIPAPAADLRIDSIDDWLGPGYGHPTPESERALALAGESEGLILDPVYTAKAMAATLALNAAGRFGDGPVLFLRCGLSPALNRWDAGGRRSSARPALAGRPAPTRSVRGIRDRRGDGRARGRVRYLLPPPVSTPGAYWSSG